MNTGFSFTAISFGAIGLLLVGLTFAVRPAPQQAPPHPPAKVAPLVWDAVAAGGETEVLVVLAEQAHLGAASTISDRQARLRYVYDTLRETALRSQAPLRAVLEEAGVDYRPFYVINMLALRGDRALVTRLAARPEVARIVANPRVRPPLSASSSPSLIPPQLERGKLSSRGCERASVEWNVARVNADAVWALGYTGEGIVVAGQDTGYDWEHPALIEQYRGWDGHSASHDYHWHDAIHSGGGSCGADSPVPCDDYGLGHGTHTMGTIVGDDGAGNQIGVAPGARWIGCRNMDEGVGTPETYTECFQFFLAPYPLGGDPFTDGEPALAPHVINNSWTCPQGEGCDWDTLQAVVENVRAAGIVVVASAGNEGGGGCSTVQDPPAIYDAAFSVGATDSNDVIAGFSSRGPVTVDGSYRLKPDVVAPGVGIRSSQRGGGYYENNGTSMAGPHVAGTVALLWSAAPALIGDVDATEQIIARAARPRVDTACGGESDGHPNNVYGWGIVDALAAVQSQPMMTVAKTARPSLARPGSPLTYTIYVTNTGNVTLHATVTDTLPTHIVTGRSGGGTTVTPGGVLTWTPVVIPPSGGWTRTVVVTVEVGYEGILTNVVQVTTEEGATGVYTETTAARRPTLAVSKRVGTGLVFPGERLTYTLLAANTIGLTLTQVVLTDTVPVGTAFAWASGDYTLDGGGSAGPGQTVAWAAISLANGETLTETLAVTVEHLPPGTRVVNAAYGVRANELLTPVMGAPVEVVIPWRRMLPLVMRD